MIPGLARFLADNKDKIVRTIKTNKVIRRVDYSEYTQWDETVSFDTEEVLDFGLLMEQIAEFEESFQPGGINYKGNK